jgi:hypothetical protein
MLKALSYPKTDLKLTKKGEDLFVWCITRKKKLLLTPEEWVRQHVIHYLISNKNIPVGLIASEYSLVINKMVRRCDIVVFGSDSKPKMIIECKAPEIKLSQAVFTQIAQYNFKLNVDYLVMTNGIDQVVCKIDRQLNKLNYLQEIPSYSQIIPIEH